MTRRFIQLLLIATCVAALRAQDVPPPPKPADNGPSLEVTMKYIVDNMGPGASFHLIAYYHDNVAGNDWTHKYQGGTTNIRTSASACRVDYHTRGSIDDQPGYDQDSWFALKAIKEVTVKPVEAELKERDAKNGHPEWSLRADPPTFLIEIKDQKNNIDHWYVQDESLGNRIARAIVHAVELCGGGDKDPFK